MAQGLKICMATPSILPKSGWACAHPANRLRHPVWLFKPSYGSDIAPASRDLEKNLSYVHYKILLIRQDTLRSDSY